MCSHFLRVLHVGVGSRVACVSRMFLQLNGNNAVSMNVLTLLCEIKQFCKVQH